ncbi:Acyl-CoA synthetase family member [Salix suchowensis]|nr:Acyl-CoA synthetase family member [Salix suchowensis]
MRTTSTASLEIMELFSKLAVDLQTLTHSSPINQQQQEFDDSSIEPSISKLTCLSLTILGLGFWTLLYHSCALQRHRSVIFLLYSKEIVLDSVVEYSVKTIVSVLSSSISCEVFRFHNEEVLQIGSFISRSHFMELIECVFDVISKLKERGMPIDLLLSAVVRVAASTSCYKYLSLSMRALNVKSIDGSITAISKLLCHLPVDFSFNHHDIPTRLLFWYLDPLALKHDITKILQETIKRPYLCLSMEFYERMDWRSILVCLVLSPIMFIDTRALLHDWFLQTGLSSVLELLMELVSLILDVISRPTWWGLSLELGLKLPFSNAYFPYKSDLLNSFTGPLSYESFLQLVHRTRKSASLNRELCDPTINPSAVRVALIDHKSIWALAISFPEWFYFASVLLFSDDKKSQQNIQVRCPLGVPEFGQLAAAAATFIAWILSPVNKSNQDTLSENLTKLSKCWNLKEISLDNSQNGMAGYKKKLKKPRFCDSKEDSTLGNKYDCQVIILWLKQFQNIMKHNETIDDMAFCESQSYALLQQHDKLFRRVPLGILIGSSSYINEDGCELLLHYAATGPEDLFGGINKEEAVSGACLVFSVTDVVMRLSVSLFETEKSGEDFLCLVKLRTGRYLLKCIKRLIQFNVDADGVPMVLDLQGRLERWRHQGREVPEFHKDLDDALKSLSTELSCYS